METVEIIIKIPRSELEYAKKGYTKAKADVVYRAIENGTILPENHGRLIDADELLSKERPNGISDDVWEESHIYKMLTNAPTIIEADKDGDTE
jgi:hypothetical protein